MIIGSAWKKLTKEGKPYMSCVIELPFLGKINFALFPIDEKDRKDPEKSPNCNIVWSAPRANNGSGAAGGDDDIPF